MEYLAHRKEYDTVQLIMSDLRDGRHKGVISQGSIYTLAFLIEKALKENGIHEPAKTEQLRQILKYVLQIVKPSNVSLDGLEQAIDDNAFSDIEDSFQYRCAIENKCKVIVTINIGDFSQAEQDNIKVLTPKQFVEKYTQRK